MKTLLDRWTQFALCKVPVWIDGSVRIIVQKVYYRAFLEGYLAGMETVVTQGPDGIQRRADGYLAEACKVLDPTDERLR